MARKRFRQWLREDAPTNNAGSAIGGYDDPSKGDVYITNNVSDADATAGNVSNLVNAHRALHNNSTPPNNGKKSASSNPKQS